VSGPTACALARARVPQTYPCGWWRKRTWWCAEARCEAKVFTEPNDALARPRALLSARACWWAMRQLRREHASVAGIARQLGTTRRTVWRAVEPLLQRELVTCLQTGRALRVPRRAALAVGLAAASGCCGVLLVGVLARVATQWCWWQPFVVVSSRSHYRASSIGGVSG